MNAAPKDAPRGAETHLEVYRPFRGQLRPRPFRFVPVLALGIRVASKRKLPMVFLYAVPLIATVVFSFVVYGFYAVDSTGLMGQDAPALLNVFAKRAMKNFEARTQIAQFLRTAQVFALLTGAWYGSGLIADDLRSGALQLWFARPLGRAAYVLGRFLTVAFFAAVAVLVPGLVILLVATVNSPDYSFASDEGDLFWRVPLYSGLWITITGLVALAVSSVARKRSWALAGLFAVFFLPEACARVLGHLIDPSWRAMGPLSSLRKLSEVLLNLEAPSTMQFSSGLAWTTVAVLFGLLLAVVAWRVRRVEVVS